MNYMQVQPIERNNLCDETYNRIIQMIASGNWSEGDKLPSENELKNLLGVSRNTVRAALNRLHALGIVDVRQGEGYFIRELNTGVLINPLIPAALINARDFLTIIEFRRGVESEIARLAALRATAEDIEKMESILQDSPRTFNNPREFSDNDMDFHLAMAIASKNDMYIQCMSIVKTLYTLTLADFVSVHGVEVSYNYHKEACKAIKDRDSEKASEILKKHMDDVAYKLRMDIEKKSNK